MSLYLDLVDQTATKRKRDEEVTSHYLDREDVAYSSSATLGLMSSDELGDLTHNPFAEDNDYVSDSNLAQGYSSSLAPKLSNPLSLSAENSVKGTIDEGGKRTRSVPEISVAPGSPGGLHPLKSALARQDDNVLYDLGITRPHLSRIISERTLMKDTLSEQGVSSTITTPPASDEEIEVIVHEVSSNIHSLFFFTDLV